MQPSNTTFLRSLISTIGWLLALLITFSIVGGGGYWALTYWGPCGIERVNRASGTLQSLLDDFQQAMPDPQDPAVWSVADLRMQAEAVERLSTPECMQPVRGSLLAYMLHQAETAEASQQGELTAAEIQQRSTDGEAKLQQYRTVLQALQACAPFCR